MNRIINYDRLTEHGNKEGRRMAAEIIDAGMTAGNPYNNVRQLIRVEGDELIFDNPMMVLKGDPKGGEPAVYHLPDIDRIFIFGVGKGMQYNIKAVEEVLGDRITGGIVLVKHGDEPLLERVEVRFGGHPIPDKAAVDACREILDMAKAAKLTEKDLVITAMGSGVGSLCTLPSEGITLEEVEYYNYLCQIDFGMPTLELTHIRNQVDDIKGGRFTKAMQPARMVNIVSGASNLGGRSYDDVVNNNSWIHSLPDRTTSAYAIETAKKHDVWDKLPESIRDKLLSNDPEGDTLSPEEFAGYDIRVFCTVPRELSALYTAMRKAEELGFSAYSMTERTTCEAKDIGRFMGELASNCEKRSQPFAPPCALFTTGELITTVRGEAGIGGTNQEYCLAAAEVIAGSERIVVAAVDTDGTDGPGGDFHPDATKNGINVLSGGLVDGYTVMEAKEKKVDIFDHLKRHDTSSALWELDSGIAAVQNISVGDLHCVLIMD